MEARRGKHGPRECAICGGTPDTDCARCGSALCDDHRHGDDARCALCEREYEARYSLRDGGLYLATVVACPALLCLVVLGALSLPMGTALAGIILVGTVAGVAMGFPWARRRLATNMRQRFLDEHPVPSARALRA